MFQLCQSLQAQGKTLEDYVAQHQDKSKNALQKSHEAAFNAWVEELKADQAQYLSEKVLHLNLYNNLYPRWVHWFFWGRRQYHQ